MHSLMTPQMVGYEVRFYDWAEFHSINDAAKRHGQVPNHVSVGIIGTDYQMWEPVVDLEGATWKRSPVVERAYNNPLFRFCMPHLAPVAPLHDIVDAHYTSSVGYHYLWHYTARLLPRPSNCVTLAHHMLRHLGVATSGHPDVVAMLKEINQCM